MGQFRLPGGEGAHDYAAAQDKQQQHNRNQPSKVAAPTNHRIAFSHSNLNRWPPAAVRGSEYGGQSRRAPENYRPAHGVSFRSTISAICARRDHNSSVGPSWLDWAAVKSGDL